MPFQRICALKSGRANLPTSPPTPAMLNEARRAIGAGPLWGGPAATVLVAGYLTALLLAARAGALVNVLAALLAGACTIVVLTVASAWCRGVDFNAWLEADPRHRRGSCQWLIWRGEYSGQPCLACLASMPRRERRRWLEVAASPGVSTGWLGYPQSGTGDPQAQLRDTGRVQVGWLAWQLLPAGILLTALAAYANPDSAVHATALPLSLAVVLTAWLNPYRLAPTHSRRGADSVAEVRSCESCGRAPGTVRVIFPDAVTFHVCALCLNAGSHKTSSDRYAEACQMTPVTNAARARRATQP